MKRLIIFTISLIGLCNAVVAGPLDTKSLDFLEIKDRKRLISIECQNPNKLLIDCENYLIIQSSTENIDSTGSTNELNSFELTKEQFENAVSEFSKKFKTKTGPRIFTAFGGAVGLLVYFIAGKMPGLITGGVGVVVGSFLDLSFAPIVVPIKIQREIYQLIRIKRNIKNLLENKKFKKIKIKTWVLNRNDNGATFYNAIKNTLTVPEEN